MTMTFNTLVHAEWTLLPDHEKALITDDFTFFRHKTNKTVIFLSHRPAKDKKFHAWSM